MTHVNRSYSGNWYYNNYHHRKRPIDKLDGTVKNKVLRHVSGKSGKVKIVNAEGFAKYAHETKGIKSLYMPEAETGSESKYVKEARYINETLQVHKDTRKLNEDNVYQLEFFYFAIVDKSFNVKLYSKDGDPEVYGHDSLQLKFDSNSLFVYCGREYQDG